MLVDPDSKVDSELEKNIKANAHKLKPYIPPCVMILIMFVIFKYWDAACNFLGLFLHAAAGLIIGMIIAFLVNIIMSTYEKGLTKLFRGKLKGGALRAVGLIASIVIEVLGMLIFKWSMNFMDYIVALIFCGFIGFDWARAQVFPKTLDNAVDSAADIYVDVANLFIRILAITGKSSD